MTIIEILLALFFIGLIGFLTGIFFFVIKGLIVIGRVVLIGIAAIVWLILLPFRRE